MEAIMKKIYLQIIILSYLLFCLVGCNKVVTHENPSEVVTSFLAALQQQNYSSAKAHYAENLDNFPNFKNKIESISPHVANELFNKMADFSYVIEQVEIDPNDTNKAIVTATFTCYDLGKAFETTILDYLKTDLNMTFEGATHDDIMKVAETTIVKSIENSEKTFVDTVNIKLTKKDDNWEIDTISDNMPLMNVLSGNILYTINDLSNILQNME